MSVTNPESNPPAFKYVGLGLAVGSGVFIGASFVFKKKGLLASQRKYATEAGESHAYLKSPMWWTGMIIMVVGEILNFVAYAFADAVLVTPMGALSVVVCAILSSIFLKERLTLFGKVGCFLCIVGSVIIAVNAPEQKTDGNIRNYEKLFIAPGFLTWLSICVVSSLILVFFVAPRYGKKSMLVYITICSVIGGLSVSVTSGLGSAIILSIRGTNQFTYWFTYFLLAFIIVTLLVEINYLNKALELFNTAAVTPTYYVLFTAATIITSVILSQGMRAKAVSIVTIVFGFFTICAGILLLQLSKMDPEELREQKGVDRKSSLLVRMTQMQTGPEREEDAAHIEDPGMDSIRGGLGVVGSLMRAKSARSRISTCLDDDALHACAQHEHDGLERYQLYDRPMSFSPEPDGDARRTGKSIKFMPGTELPHGHHGQGTPLEPSAHEMPHMLVPILEKGEDAMPGKSEQSSLLGDDISLTDYHADVGDQTTATDMHRVGTSSPYDVDMLRMWHDEPVFDKMSNVASPTGIVEAYYDEEDAAERVHRAHAHPPRSLGILPRGRTHIFRRHTHDPNTSALGLGLFKSRKFSRGAHDPLAHRDALPHAKRVVSDSTRASCEAQQLLE